MSDPLAAANQALVTLLASAIADVPAFPEPPEKALPPFIVAGPADPWLDFEGAPFGYCRVHQHATLITERGTNDVRVAALRTGAVAIAKAIDAADDFAVTQIEQPGQISINGQDHLAVSVTCVTEVPF